MAESALPLTKIDGNYTLTERVYLTIKEAILTLQLKPASQLVEDELARQLGTSKTPVRDALLALERDGLVTKIPYKGTYVADVSPVDVEEIFELRAVLEGLAARLAVHSFSDEHIAEAEQTLNRADEARQRGELDAASQFGERFHNSILVRADNRHLSPILKNLDNQMRRLRLLSNRFEARLGKSAGEHRQVLVALRARDADGVEQAMRHHLQSVLDDMLADEARAESVVGKETAR